MYSRVRESEYDRHNIITVFISILHNINYRKYIKTIVDKSKFCTNKPLQNTG